MIQSSENLVTQGRTDGRTDRQIVTNVMAVTIIAVANLSYLSL